MLTLELIKIQYSSASLCRVETVLTTFLLIPLDHFQPAAQGTDKEHNKNSKLLPFEDCHGHQVKQQRQVFSQLLRVLSFVVVKKVVSVFFHNVVMLLANLNSFLFKKCSLWAINSVKLTDV